MPTVFQPDFRMPHDARRTGSGASAATPARPSHPRTRRHYFTEVAVDYSAWSPSYNMHFGFWRAGLNPLRREGMLVEMNRVIGRALRLPAQQLASPQGSAPRRCVLDLGCGAGATARTLVGDDPSLYAITVTNVAVQNRIAARLDAAAGVADRMAHIEADYTRTGLPAAQADGAWAVESACYAEGTAKADFVREAARLLKPGARLAVVDGFLLRRAPGRMAGWLHRLWADSWAVPTLAVRDDFVAALRAQRLRGHRGEVAALARGAQRAAHPGAGHALHAGRTLEGARQAQPVAAQAHRGELLRARAGHVLARLRLLHGHRQRAPTERIG
jgi:SAM-dependent methyltransferase